MAKTFTFAILHFTVAFSVAYLLTGSIAISSTVALVEPIVNTVAFYFHEKAWQRIEKKRYAAQPQQAETASPKVIAWANVESKPTFFCCGHQKLCQAAGGNNCPSK